ncbi:MAG: hypothetical protein LQ346_004326 [Caloplaca aetnensis]|nr:MAG: hypothetical protein LQ346_004326 [Caloplaca aetnensis]
MLRSSSTGEPTDGTRASWGGMDDLEEATTQKSSNTHSGTEIEHPLSRTSIPPIRAFRSSGNRRRQHLGPTEYTVFGTTTVPLSLISSSGRCPADPLRAIERSSIAALTFCWSYVRDFSQPGPLPTFLSKYDHDQVSNACMCFYGPGVLYSSLALPTTTTSLPQTSSLPPKVRSLPTRTSRSLSSPDPATEDATYARPSEYHGAEPTSEATITATVQGPTSVPDPGRRTQRQSLSALLMPNPATEDATYSRPHEYYGPDPTSEATITAVAESVATHYETFTLVNVPVTVLSFTRGHMTDTAVPTAIANPYTWAGGGNTLSQAVVAVSVIVPFAVVLGLGDSCQRGDKYKCFVTYFSILEIRFE